jgi:hypothetical protein
MYQKVSIDQLFLLEIWGAQGFLAPAPAAFHTSNQKWVAEGTFGGKPFKVEIGEDSVSNEELGVELPIPTADNTSFEITFTRGQETDSVKGITKFL